ncbi:MAG TPA: hypothetical protein VIE15_04620 [Acidimicrobiales bacterium]
MSVRSILARVAADMAGRPGVELVGHPSGPSESKVIAEDAARNVAVSDSFALHGGRTAWASSIQVAGHLYVRFNAAFAMAWAASPSPHAPSAAATTWARETRAAAAATGGHWYRGSEVNAFTATTVVGHTAAPLSFLTTVLRQFRTAPPGAVGKGRVAPLGATSVLPLLYPHQGVVLEVSTGPTPLIVGVTLDLPGYAPTQFLVSWPRALTISGPTATTSVCDVVHRSNYAGFTRLNGNRAAQFPQCDR